jgi:hypothetical protein
MRKKWIFIVPLAMLAMVLIAFMGGEVVKLLWNWLLPPLFGWHRLTFWQAFGMLALCRILFGGIAGRGMYRTDARRRIAERLEAMTPEERQRVRQGIRERFGFGTSTTDKPEQ